MDTVGTVGVLNAGSVVVTAGTIGDLDTVGTVGVVNAGSVVVTAGTVIASNGSVVVKSGTLTTGTLQNLVSGTINAGSVVLNSGTVTTGSLSNLATLGTVLNINDGTITPNLTNDRTATGTLTGAGQNVAINTNGIGAVGIRVGGTTFTGTIQVESTFDDSAWVSAYTTYGDLGFGLNWFTQIISNDEYVVPVQGFSQIRLRASAFTSGSAIINMRAHQQSLTFFTNSVEEAQQVDTTNNLDTAIVVAGMETDSSQYRFLRIDTGDESLKTSLTKGTITKVEGGTLGALAVGTITTGTINREGYRAINQATSFGTVGTASGSLFATISAASGAGTVHLVSGVDIIQVTGTSEILVLYGSALTGGSVLAQGAFAPGGGISKTFVPPIESGTNSEIIYHFVGAGTARITSQYWKTT